MDNAGGIPTKEVPVGLDASAQEEFASLSVLLQEFSKITTIDKAWTIKPQNGMIASVSSHAIPFCLLIFIYAQVYFVIKFDFNYLFIKYVAGDSTSAMFLIGQSDLLSNKRRKSILTSHISQKTDSSVSFRWAPFPVEMTGVSAMVPSPSGSKLLVVRNSEGDSPTHFEIWGASELKKDFAIPRKIHGSVYTDGW